LIETNSESTDELNISEKKLQIKNEKDKESDSLNNYNELFKNFNG
jgi:hypothetical protein